MTRVLVAALLACLAAPLGAEKREQPTEPE